MTHENWDQHHARTRRGHGHGDGVGPRWATAELAGFLAGLAERPSRALDLGCGAGDDAVLLARQGIDATGVDLSEMALDRARQLALQHGVHVEWLLADVLDLPLEDGSMDLVLDHGCLHHVAASDQPRYAAEVARVLRPGGLLLIRERNDPAHHHHAVSGEQVAAMVEGTPLRVRTTTTYEAASGEIGTRSVLVVVVRS